jgi:hypothetical protein
MIPIQAQLSDPMDPDDIKQLVLDAAALFALIDFVAESAIWDEEAAQTTPVGL